MFNAFHEKKEKQIFFYFVLFFCILLVKPANVYSDESPVQISSSTPEKKYYLFTMQTSALFSTKGRRIFPIDYIIPLYYPDDHTTLLFFNPKQVYGSPFTEEYNIGGGLRKLFLDKYIVGIHSFYDRKYTQNKVWHTQWGMGLEFLSDFVDVRFNYYYPEHSPKLVESGYSFGQTNLLHWEQYEEALKGCDFEVGFPLIPRKLNTRFFLGGFFYDSKLSDNINGFRFRSETALNKWLSVDMQYNAPNHGNDEFVGGLRITIPFEAGRILDRNGNPIQMSETDTMKRRMFERVVRDIDIQTVSPVITEVDTDAGDMIYVDNTNSGVEDGTLAHPWNTLDEAFSDARYAQGVNIYVFRGDGTSSGYTGQYQLDFDEVTLWGSGYDGGYPGIPVYGYPVIDGDGGNAVTINADNDTVQGFQIQNSDCAVFSAHTTGTKILANDLSNNASGFGYVNNEVNSGLTIWGNTINNNTQEGAVIYNYWTGDLSGVTIENNVIQGNQPLKSGIRILNLGTIRDVDILNNDLSNNIGNGLTIQSINSMSDFTISGNTINDNGQNGILIENWGYFYSGSTNMSDFIISGNTINNNALHGIRIDNYGFSYYPGSTTNISDFTINANTITNNGADGISLWNGSFYGSANMSDFTFDGNTISTNADSGINIENYWGTISDFTFNANTITGNTGAYSGIHIDNMYYGTMSNFDFTRNTVSSNAGYGIFAGNYESWMSNFNFTGNTIRNNGRDGIMFENSFYTIDTINAGHNVITGNGGDGIGLDNNGGTFDNVNFGNATAGTQGNNSIFGNTGFDIRNNSGIDNLTAENNFWGAGPATTDGANTVDAEPYLTVDPN